MASSAKSTSSNSLPDRTSQSQSKILPISTKPPKSKTEAYYAVHPSWTDLSPIPQLDLDQPSTYTSGSKPLSDATAQKLASAGPALATIAYTPRYVEAMAYLRAIMAMEEYSERALILTEDIIGMNPAHYTVWIYRFRVLKELWGTFWTPAADGRAVVSDGARIGFDQELKWLERMSEKNLKNYQIWHHRQSLFQLLPPTPSTTSANWITSLLVNEPDFLRTILALDTKNYHVWSYRQWLCAHFPDHFLVNNAQELQAMNTMIDQDVMNNSAWNHRYFINFGFHRNVEEQNQLATQTSSWSSQTNDPSAKSVKSNDAVIIDLDIIDRELDYVQDKIRYAPQNGSTWNYLKGILKHAGLLVSEMKSFCAEFVGEGFTFDTLDGENGTKGVRSSQAVEMCVEIFATEALDGSVEARDKVRSALDMLSAKWDPIRKRYWGWRLDRYEASWKDV